MTINEATRSLVRQRAKSVCEYCHSLEEASAAQFAIDHILPQSRGGSDELDNLALACQRCNSYRYNFTEGIDPLTQQSITLFNPREQNWSDHFIVWSRSMAAKFQTLCRSPGFRHWREQWRQAIAPEIVRRVLP